MSVRNASCGRGKLCWLWLLTVQLCVLKANARRIGLVLLPSGFRYRYAATYRRFRSRRVVDYLAIARFRHAETGLE